MELHDRIKDTVTAVFNQTSDTNERIEGVTHLMHLEIMAIATQYARHMNAMSEPDYSREFDHFISEIYPVDR